MRSISDNLWWLDAAHQPGASLWGEHEADVVIIGGGFTGLASAYFIKQRFPNRKVILLEKEFVGHGSSGRNTGISGATLGHSLLRLTKKFGPEKIAAIQPLATQSFHLVEELIREHSISCDYERSGLLILARNAREAGVLEQEARACENAGLEAALLDGAQASSHFGALKATAALTHSAQGMLNPAKLARGMKRVIESLGVQVFENSRCISFDPGRRIIVYTSAGRIAADSAVIATNAYPDPLGLFRHKVMPFYVYNIATEPLTSGQLERFEWPGRTIVFNTKHIFWVLRLTADNRIVFIYNDARYFLNTDGDYSHRPSDYLMHYRLLTKLFPFLKDIQLTHAWGGRIGMTLDFLPALGRTGKSQNIYYSAGYNGHGVAFSQLAGKMIAALMADEQSDLTKNMLINRALRGVPSDALTYLAANGLKLAYQAADRLHD